MIVSLCFVAQTLSLEAAAKVRSFFYPPNVFLIFFSETPREASVLQSLWKADANIVGLVPLFQTQNH